MAARSMMLLGAALLVAVAVGCGGADDDGGAGAGAQGTGAGAYADGGSGPPSKEQFVERANRVCGEEWGKLVPRITAYNRERDSLVRDGTPAYAGLAEAAFLRTYEQELEAVRDLQPPAGEEQRVEALLAAHQRAIEQTADREVESFDELQNALRPTSRALARYGLSRCAASGF